MDILRNISVILVEPASPGNIGAVARTLRNTGLSRLRLVNPCASWNCDDARRIAHGSTDILDNAEIFPDLASSLGDVQFAIGATHRTGRYREVDDDYSQVLRAGLDLTGHLGLVFGREKDGLWRSELDLCQRLVRIPSAVTYPSFNLSHAVLLITYELFRLGSQSKTTPPPRELASGDELERLYEDICQAMETIEFRPYNDNPKNFSRVVRRVLSRTPLEKRDIKVVHLVCAQIRKFSTKHGAPFTTNHTPDKSARDQ